MNDPAAPTVIDTLGKACPIPVIELARTLEDQPSGVTVVLLADDPGAKVDIPVWCRMKGAVLEGVEVEPGERGDRFRFTVTQG